ncbi:tegument protein, virion shutoff protein [Gallid alphaherpesvirus 2]|uniref:Virion host shutoff protein n=1 Tax=Gallid alphaherpesvirus 2 TaxID=10390 RepID=I6TP37_9ALPH|nr:tegument protein, virion shutoff protein [Gallid alphaherpesvirus 2]
MGVYGCMNFAYANGLVRSHISGFISGGDMTPIAVDLWNVMYGLLEKLYPGKIDGVDDSIITLRCLYCLLRLLHQRSYYPVFVADRGFYGNGKTLYGAKAIAATCIANRGGSGRLHARLFDECGSTDVGEARCKRKPPGKKVCRWSERFETPKILYQLCMSIIRYMGYPYVDAGTMEADDICANLFHTKTVAYVLSSDTDLILMGCDIIIDLTRIFPPTIYCRDVLAALQMDYFTFLLNFVRCHTDLHREPTLKSMQEIINLSSAKRCLHDTDCATDDDVPRCIRPLYEEQDRRTGENSYHSEGFDLHIRKDQSKTSCWDNDVSNYTDTNLIRGVQKALKSLRPPRTRCEILEYKFIKHAIATIIPERRTSRVSILKRFPIMQEGRDETAVEDLIFCNIFDVDEASTIVSQFIKRIPEVRPLNHILLKYWGNDALKTTRSND